MKKWSLLLALLLLWSAPGVPARAEEAIRESASGFWFVEETDAQAALSVSDRTLLIRQDGLYFKDLNRNGTLDVYEDWRADVEARVEDLLCQMTLQEKAGTLFYSSLLGTAAQTVTDYRSEAAKALGPARAPLLDDPETALQSHSVVERIEGVAVCPMAWQMQDMSVTTFLVDLTGAPQDQLALLNALQAVSEGHRLGIPSEFATTRGYPTWGGMIDMAHDALGTAGDAELLHRLATAYAREAAALGYHQVILSGGDGSWYGAGESALPAARTQAYNQFGLSAHARGFLTRDGQGETPERTMADWQAVVDAGAEWIMLSPGEGRTPGVPACMDRVTLETLRTAMGYDGLVTMDWPGGARQLMQQTGVTADGVDVAALTIQERYALMLHAGVDMLSAMGVTSGLDVNAWPELGGAGMPDAVVDAVQQGLVTEEVFHSHVRRVLHHKFAAGLFEDPYADWQEALQLIGSEAYQADPGVVPLTLEELDALRRPELVALERELMGKSVVMLKNDGVLPLGWEARVCVQSNDPAIRHAVEELLAEWAIVVGKISESEVVLLHVTAFNEVYREILADAQRQEKPVVLIVEGTLRQGGVQSEPRGEQVAAANAVLLHTYRNTPEAHSVPVGSYYRYVAPEIISDLLYGDVNPGGTTAREIPFASEQLPYVVAMDQELFVSLLFTPMKSRPQQEEPEALLPPDAGEVLYPAGFGMTFDDPARITLTMLTVDKASVTTVDADGLAVTTQENAVQRAGEPFTIRVTAHNAGGDGHVTVLVTDNGRPIAEKFVAVKGGESREIPIELTLKYGNHSIAVGDMVETIVVK